MFNFKKKKPAETQVRKFEKPEKKPLLTIGRTIEGEDVAIDLNWGLMLRSHDREKKTGFLMDLCAQMEGNPEYKVYALFRDSERLKKLHGRNIELLPFTFDAVLGLVEMLEADRDARFDELDSSGRNYYSKGPRLVVVFDDIDVLLNDLTPEEYDKESFTWRLYHLTKFSKALKITYFFAGGDGFHNGVIGSPTCVELQNRIILGSNSSHFRMVSGMLGSDSEADEIYDSVYQLLDHSESPLVHFKTLSELQADSQ